MDFTYGGIKMKKALLLALIAMMLISMFAFSACKKNDTADANAEDSIAAEPMPEPVPAATDSLNQTAPVTDPAAAPAATTPAPGRK